MWPVFARARRECVGALRGAEAKSGKPDDTADSVSLAAQPSFLRAKFGHAVINGAKKPSSRCP